MLHLVEPLCFDMDDTKLKRAGLDYHDLAHVKVHPNLDSALDAVPGNVYAFTGHTSNMYTDVHYESDDGLMRVRIHMVENIRSLNLANSASIALYEAWRQLGFPGGV